MCNWTWPSSLLRWRVQPSLLRWRVQPSLCFILNESTTTWLKSVKSTQTTSGILSLRVLAVFGVNVVTYIMESLKYNRSGWELPLTSDEKWNGTVHIILTGKRQAAMEDRDSCSQFWMRSGRNPVIARMSWSASRSLLVPTPQSLEDRAGFWDAPCSFWAVFFQGRRVVIFRASKPPTKAEHVRTSLLSVSFALCLPFH